MEILRKNTVPAEFRVIARNSAETAFPQNFHTRKLAEITVFHTV